MQGKAIPEPIIGKGMRHLGFPAAFLAVWKPISTRTVSRIGNFRFGARGFVEESTSPRVLIVEDEWLVRMELADAFVELGFTVVESASAEHATEVLVTGSPVALLVTDIRLAGTRDGWDLAADARGASPEIAVIYLSANPPALDRIVPGSIFIDKPALMKRVTGAALELLQIPSRPG